MQESIEILPYTEQKNAKKATKNIQVLDPKICKSPTQKMQVIGQKKSKSSTKNMPVIELKNACHQAKAVCQRPKNASHRTKKWKS